MTTHRKLAAILSADVAGYSRLMADDEAATLRLLNDARSLFRERIHAHGGRLIDTAGDSVLAEFPSAVEAVDCASEIQRELAKRNAQLAEHRRMVFRIGINLGDVIEQADGTIYGDGVNVAARLQALADPEGICISGTAFDQVEGKLPIRFKFIGEQQVKNIPKPVRAYKALTDPPVGKSGQVGKRRALGIGAAVIVAVVVGGGIVWKGQQSYLKQAAQLNDPALAMPSGLSIAVLPFTNMSADSKEDYFSDGLTEDIITELARFRELHVLARNTTFQYKGQAVDIQTLGRKLGATYVLEGSVRKSSDRLRITAQLIDVATGAHIWVERYDRELRDIFTLQDEITSKVIGAIAGGFGSVLQRAGGPATDRKRPDQFEAYDLVLRAKANFYYSREAYPKAKALLEKAIALDPANAQALQEYAWLLLMGYIFRFENTELPPEAIKHNAIRAVELDPADALAHRTAAFGYFFDHQLDLFEREVNLAFELAPFNAEILAQLGAVVTFTGQWDRGIALTNKAISLNPVSAAGWSHSARFFDHFRKKEYAKAIEVIRQHPAQGICETINKYVSAYGQMGQPDKAKEYWSRCLAVEPTFSPERVSQLSDIWNLPPSLTRQFLEGFAKAGLPCKRPNCELQQ